MRVNTSTHIFGSHAQIPTLSRMSIRRSGIVFDAEFPVPLLETPIDVYTCQYGYARIIRLISLYKMHFALNSIWNCFHWSSSNKFVIVSNDGWCEEACHYINYWWLASLLHWCVTRLHYITDRFYMWKAVPYNSNNLPLYIHWGRAAHICVGGLTIIGSDNVLSPCRRQAIISTNDGILLNGPSGTNLSKILIKIHSFCLVLNVLTH